MSVLLGVITSVPYNVDAVIKCRAAPQEGPRWTGVPVTLSATVVAHCRSRARFIVSLLAPPVLAYLFLFERSQTFTPDRIESLLSRTKHIRNLGKLCVRGFG